MDGPCLLMWLIGQRGFSMFFHNMPILEGVDVLRRCNFESSKEVYGL